MQHPADATGIKGEVIHEQLGAGINQGAAPAAITKLQCQAPAVEVIAIHHGASLEQRGFKQLGFGLEIGLQRWVVIEMVLAEVGEHRPSEPTAAHPVLIQRMGAHLHGPKPATGSHRRGEIRLQLIGKRGGVHRSPAVTRPTVGQGAEQGTGHSTTESQVLNQMGGGGFAVGAGHPDELQLLAGLPPERSSQTPCHLSHRISNHQHRVSR